MLALHVLEPSCGANKFRCTDGSCINSEYRCDDIPDCPDKSDELYCDGGYLLNKSTHYILFLRKVLV